MVETSSSVPSSPSGDGPEPGPVPSIDGRRFRAVRNAESGEVDDATTFEYQQAGSTIEGRYHGGRVQLGYLVGIRDGDELDFRYVHLNVDGETSSGHCHTRLELTDDRRVRMHENWEWESRPGSGTSVVEELLEAE